MDHNTVNDMAYLGLLGFVLLCFWFFRSPWFKGVSGEFWVKSALRSGLGETEYALLNDLTLPVRGGTTQIDHIVVSRHGIFVVETKNMSGWIFGSADQRTWTQTFRRKKFKMQNPTHQNFKHVKAVQELLGVPQRKIHNVVAFVGSARPRTQMPPNVVWSVRELIKYIKSFDQLLLGEDEVPTTVKKLSEGAVENSRKTRRNHVTHVKSLSGQQGTMLAKCPKCGSAMAKRTNRKSSSEFLGCSNYPKCKGTRRIQ
ncbi:nuclease-related domain-containing protein [Ruegeria arenilitoris]|uniref:nuclease-related domain-containing protein n=1 Tax=Ruegeria arenilitoris TaxID=1173585 RepID=UPI00147F3157|nr:NERD domain-containing protein [Ruegeria arenilitoris]